VEGITYATYKALSITAMHPDIPSHPDPLVETASLASVPLPPATFQHSLHDIVNARLLSDAQLETVIYASQKFHGSRLPDGKRAGFFLGDGAGVGKGRQIAALIKQNWAEGGRHVLWVSVSNDLRRDAERDLADVDGQEIEVHTRTTALPTGALGYTGVLFVTYSLLVSGLRKGGANADKPEELNEEDEAMGGAVPGAPAPAPGRRRKNKRDDTAIEDRRLVLPAGCRLGQVIAWLQQCPKGAFIIFDESHKAKNLIPAKGAQSTITARAIVELQAALPNAKVLYSSATGASEPRNLAYMTRLNQGFQNVAEMVDLLKEAKLGALELAAMSMKATGSYLARTLSYQGAEFAIVKAEMDPAFVIMYDRASFFWFLLYRIMFGPTAEEWKKRKQSLFWGYHQRFFKSMLMAAKVPACAALAKEAVRRGEAVVIGLQSTGESNTKAKRASGEELEDLVRSQGCM
jgi:hypothetical protein